MIARIVFYLVFTLLVLMTLVLVGAAAYDHLIIARSEAALLHLQKP